VYSWRGKIFALEKLDVWSETRGFAHSIFKITSKINRRYLSATQQLERAALFVSLNVAEGAGRKSKADFQRFIKISNGSLNETLTLLLFLKEASQISDEEYLAHYDWLTKIAKMLNSLYNSLK
jgi:four helix bundle protein